MGFCDTAKQFIPCIIAVSYKNRESDKDTVKNRETRKKAEQKQTTGLLGHSPVIFCQILNFDTAVFVRLHGDDDHQIDH